MSASPRIGPSRAFAVYDPESGKIVARLRVPAFRLKQQMAAWPGLKVLRVDSLSSTRRRKVVNGALVPIE